MAKVTLENSREHDIVINVTDKDGAVHQAIIPGATASTTEPGKSVPGLSEEVDSSLLELAKKNKVVKFYFEEGWLKESKGKAAAKEDDDKKDEKKDEKKDDKK